MKLKYAKPFKGHKGIMSFITDSDAVRDDPPTLQLGVRDIHVEYAAKAFVEWKGEIGIPEGNWGSLGPHKDMVYFTSGEYGCPKKTDYTFGIPIEVILLNPDAFEPRLEVSHQIELSL